MYIACEMYRVWILRRFHAFIEMFWFLSQMFCCFSLIIYNKGQSRPKKLVGGISSFNVATLPNQLYFQMNQTGPRFWKGFAWRVLYCNGLSNTLNYVNYAEMQVSATELV